LSGTQHNTLFSIIGTSTQHNTLFSHRKKGLVEWLKAYILRGREGKGRGGEGRGGKERTHQNLWDAGRVVLVAMSSKRSQIRSVA
jgi:hypothetical protein